jgi:hypothetical protein
VNTDNTTLTTAFACPDWCDGERVHGDDYGIETASGDPIRFHEKVIARGDGFTVWLAAKERITEAGRVDEPVTIGIDQDGFGDRLDRMTPAQVRLLEAALAVALAQVHDIEAR